jgi:hypothetical protein
MKKAHSSHPSVNEFNHSLSGADQSRRSFLKTSAIVGSGLLVSCSAGREALMTSGNAPDIIFRNGRFTTLDRKNPQASAVAIKDGLFHTVGDDSAVMKLAAAST